VSINTIFGTGLTGLLTSQTAIRNTSNNIANVNTPGYARTDTQFVARTLAGAGSGVDVGEVRRVVNEFLETTVLRAASDARAGEVSAELLDRAQSQLGAPGDPGSLFSRLEAAFGEIGSAALNPTVNSGRVAAVDSVDQLFQEFSRLSGELRSLRAEADTSLGDAVTAINSLIGEIHNLNGEIAKLKPAGADVTGLENRQAALLDQLSGYMDVRSQKAANGGLILRTSDGVELLGVEAKTLTYEPAGRGDMNTVYGRVLLQSPSGSTIDLEPHIQSGEVRALIDARDEELPALINELSELASGTADALNQAHNDAVALPPPNTLTGRNTGLLAGDDLNFSGATTLSVVNADGTLARRLDIDFDAGTIAIDGGAPGAIGGTSVGDLVTAIDTALGGSGSASFTNGVLEISATGGAGLALLQDEANPSDRAGRGFSHFFGLNDLVSSPRPGFFETGLTDADAHGFAAGETMRFQVTAPNGTVREIDVAVPAGATFADLRTAINDATTGIGAYGTIAFDSDGQLGFNPASGYAITMTADGTSRGGTGLSLPDMFGLSNGVAGARAEIFSVNDRIDNDPAQLGMAKLNLSSGAVGDLVVAAGDNRGGISIEQALTASRAFDAAGGINGGNFSLDAYARRFATDAGFRASRAEARMESARALSDQTQAKRAETSGVNIDEELAKMTLYQQSYNASARLIQAAKEMSDVLLTMV